ncbi:MAG: cation diffusion facilitator family transporter, partial [Planctomycetota bacterium]|nr:cation diffusion facilitator family transporter [Planctomycetota bacterium]
GFVIAFEATRRLIMPPTLRRLDEGALALLVVAFLSLALALFVLHHAKRHNNQVLRADGMHLLTDVGTTFGAAAGLFLVHLTSIPWIDPVIAFIFAALIVRTGWTLLNESINGLMDRVDPADEAAAREILDAAVAAARIRGYHKLRTRRNGPFSWIDMHIQVDPALNVSRAHTLASEIEHEIEQRIGAANATAHIEPADSARSDADSPP